jgi:plasmid stability protein
MDKSKYTSLPIERGLHRDLKVRAAQRGMQFSAYVDGILRMGISSEDGDKYPAKETNTQVTA